MCFQCFYQTSRLVCFRGFVCFKLLGKAAPSYLVYASHNTEALPLVYLAGDQGDFDVYHPITFLPRSHCSSSSSIVLLHCRYAMQLLQCIIICGSEIYLSIFLSIGRIALYICMCCFLCVKVSTLTILYICRWYELYVLGFYCLFCTWWLICTPTSPAPPSPTSQSMLWWFYVMMVWTYQMKEHLNLNAAYRWGFFTVCKWEH